MSKLTKVAQYLTLKYGDFSDEEDKKEYERETQFYIQSAQKDIQELNNMADSIPWMFYKDVTSALVTSIRQMEMALERFKKDNIDKDLFS